MKDFEANFARAVSLLLMEKGEGKSKPSPTPENTAKTGADLVKFSPGPGNWSDVIRGLKAEANTPYSEAIKNSLAVKNSNSLMIKLGVTKKATNRDETVAAAEILSQAVKNQTMSEVYDTPTGKPGKVSIPLKMPTDRESVQDGEGIAPRNIAVFIHLTLVGACNAGLLPIQKPIKVSLPEPGDDEITIVFA